MTSLDSCDYQNLLSVLADASGFSDLRFFEQLGDSLARHLGWTDAVVVNVADGENGVATLTDLRERGVEAEWDLVDEYVRRHRIGDALFGRIDAGAAGSALICRCVSGETRVDDREIALMELLTRHLAPRLREYFAHSQVIRDGSVLTDREAQVVGLVAQGLSNRLIADELHIRLDTVKKHVMSAMQKTGAGNRTQLALFHHRR